MWQYGAVGIEIDDIKTEGLVSFISLLLLPCAQCFAYASVHYPLPSNSSHHTILKPFYRNWYKIHFRFYDCLNKYPIYGFGRPLALTAARLRCNHRQFHSNMFLCVMVYEDECTMPYALVPMQAWLWDWKEGSRKRIIEMPLSCLNFTFSIKWWWMAIAIRTNENTYTRVTAMDEWLVLLCFETAY